MKHTHTFPSGGWVIFNPAAGVFATFATDDGAQLVQVDVAELVTWVLSLPIEVLDRVPLPKNIEHTLTVVEIRERTTKPPPYPAMGDCQWTYCPNPAVTFRLHHAETLPDVWLAVCQDHAEGT